jgi:hypothetical protein
MHYFIRKRPAPGRGFLFATEVTEYVLKGDREMKKHWKIPLYVMCILIVLPSVGYASSLFKNHGKIIPDGNVTKAFETYQINPNYHYYISGSDTYPHAILGLDKAYNLEPDLWKRVDMTPEKLRELVTDMQSKVMSVNIRLSLKGFALLDDKGKQIGTWYSIITATTSLRMKDDRTVVIVTPDIDTYFRYDNR